jgi:hypothetical protein
MYMKGRNDRMKIRLALLAALCCFTFGLSSAQAQVVNPYPYGYPSTAGYPTSAYPYGSPTTTGYPTRAYPYGYPTTGATVPVPYNGASPIVNGVPVPTALPFPYGASANYPYGYPTAAGTVLSPTGVGQVQVYGSATRDANGVISPYGYPVNTSTGAYTYPYFPAKVGTPTSFPRTGVSASPQTASELLQYYQAHPYGK